MAIKETVALANAQAYKAEKAAAWARKGVKYGSAYKAAAAASNKSAKASKPARKSAAKKPKAGN